MTLFPALLAIALAGASPQKSGDVDMRCGAYCLYVSLKALDARAPSYADIEAKLGAPNDSGYSLGALADAAEGYGAHVLGGDIILQLGESKIGNLEDFDSALRKFKAGDKAPVVVKRGKEELKFEVVLEPPR